MCNVPNNESTFFALNSLAAREETTIKIRMHTDLGRNTISSFPLSRQYTECQDTTFLEIDPFSIHEYLDFRHFRQKSLALRFTSKM